MKERFYFDGGYVLDSHMAVKEGIQTTVAMNPRSTKTALSFTYNATPEANIALNGPIFERFV